MESFIEGHVVSDEMHKLVIAIEDEAQCHTCGLRDSCSNKTLILNKTELDYQPPKGDRVQVIYKKLLQTALLLYLFPLLAFFAGIVLGSVLLEKQNELFLFLTGVLFLVIALILVRLFGRYLNIKDYKIEIRPVR